MNTRAVVLFVGYQAAWWGAALLARAGMGNAATAAMLAFAGVAWAFDRNRRARAQLMAACLACGIVLDGSLRAAGVLTFPAALDGAPSPAFLMAIWVGFALALPIPFVSARPAVAAALGAVGGALAYRGGAALGVLTIAPEPVGSVLVGALWALAFPLLGALALRLKL